jgi:phosphoglycerate dehydrogenase-like enzyme
VRILVSEPTYDRYASRVRGVQPDTEFLIFAGDGTVRTEAGEVVWPAADAFEVAWATHDLFIGDGWRAYFRLLDDSTAVRWVQSPGAGLDAPTFRSLIVRGVRLTTSHVTSIPIAEFVMRSVLEVFQRPEEWRAVRAARRWDHHTFREVFGTTWLVVGMGAIGSDVALRARAFGARVIGCRRHPTGDEPVDEMILPARLPATIGSADVVVLAAPGTAETRHLIDAGALAAMKAGSVLVNVARGSLVDEAALLDALDAGRPAAAVLDAVAPEPPAPASRIWDHPRVVLTPHNSFAGEGSTGRNVELFLTNMGRYTGGDRLINEEPG